MAGQPWRNSVPGPCTPWQARRFTSSWGIIDCQELTIVNQVLCSTECPLSQQEKKKMTTTEYWKGTCDHDHCGMSTHPDYERGRNLWTIHKYWSRRKRRQKTQLHCNMKCPLKEPSSGCVAVVKESMAVKGLSKLSLWKSICSPALGCFSQLTVQLQGVEPTNTQLLVTVAAASSSLSNSSTV